VHDLVDLVADQVWAAAGATRLPWAPQPGRTTSGGA
jgi:hypothetical protein